MFIPAKLHYVSYILVDGTWLMFDDSARQPSLRHPQTAISEGHIPYYTVYQQLKGKTDLPVDNSGQFTMGHMFTTDEEAPDAKVADLYETTSTSPPDDDYRPQSPGGSPVLNCPNCDYHTFHQEELDQHMSSTHATLSDPMQTDLHCGQCAQVFKDQATHDAHVQQAHTATGDMPVTRALHTVQQQLQSLCQQQGEIKATLDTHIQGAAPADESPVMQLLRQIQQQQTEMQATLERQAQRQQSFQATLERQAQQQQSFQATLEHQAQQQQSFQDTLEHRAQQQQSFQDTGLKRRELENLQAARARDEERSQDLMARSDEMVAMGRTFKERASEFQQRSQQITMREHELQQELGAE